MTTEQSETGPLTAAYQRAEIQLLEALQATQDFLRERAAILARAKAAAAGGEARSVAEQMALDRAVKTLPARLALLSARINSSEAAVRAAGNPALPAWLAGREPLPAHRPGLILQSLMDQLEAAIRDPRQEGE